MSWLQCASVSRITLWTEKKTPPKTGGVEVGAVTGQSKSESLFAVDAFIFSQTQEPMK